MGRLLKAVLVGWCTVIGLPLLLAWLCTPFWLTLCLLSFRATLFFDAASTSLVPWFSMLAVGAALAVGGYVTAARLPSRKVTAGLLLSGTLVLFRASLFAVGEDFGEAEDVVELLWVVPWVLVFPVLGAWYEKRRRPWHGPLGLLRKAWVLTVYAAVPWGLLLPTCWLLVRALYPGPFDEWSFGFKPAQLGPAWGWLACGGGAVLLGYGLLCFVRLKGLRRGLLLNGYLALAVAVTATFAVAFVRRDRANRPDVERLDRMAGELDAAFDLADVTNAAVLYMRAAAVAGREEAPEDLPDTMTGWDEPAPHLLDWLARQDEAVALALAGAQRPEGHFPYQLSADELSWRFGDLVPLRDVMLARARRLGGSGRTAQALESLDALHHMGAVLSEGTLMKVAGGRGTQDMVVRALREIAEQPAFPADDIALVRERLERWASAPAPTRAQWEAAVLFDLGYQMSEIFMRVQLTGPGSYLTSQFVSLPWVLDAQRAAVLDLFEEDDWLSVMRGFEAAPRRGINLIFEPASAPFMGEGGRRGLGLALNTLDVSSSDVAYLLSVRTRLALVQAEAALMQRAESTGPGAASWEQLIPEYLPGPPEDPFSGEPLKLRHVDGAVLVYSVGRDGEDDGGSTWFSAQEAQADRSEYVAYVDDLGVVVPASARPDVARALMAEWAEARD